MRELIVSISIRLGIYKQLMKWDNHRQMRQQNRAFSKYGLETLRRAQEAARESGCQLFLAFGTLLGAYRNKGFIPYDCDLDTGMRIEQRGEAFLDAMRRQGLKLIRQYYAQDTGRVEEEMFDYMGVHLDVHYYYVNEQGGLSCDLCLPHETKDWRSANKSDGFPAIVRSVPITDFEETDFLGIKVYTPVRVVDWLSALYGEHFMTPDPQWSMGDHKKRSVMTAYRLFRREY